MCEFARLEEICGRDDGGRGSGPLVEGTRGNLEAAARSIAGHPAPSLAIITGFFIPDADPPSAETDGPPGAAHLAAAFAGARVPVRLATDEPCAGAVRAAAAATGAGEVPLDVLAVTPGDAEVAGVLDAWRTVTHVVAIERVGPGADGRCRTMRGHDVSERTAPLDRLFTSGERVRIGIGDGGNELGMGKVRDLVIRHVPRGGEIACSVGCDHLIVCGVSNWGAWALTAALGFLRDDWRAAMRTTEERELRILEATVREGRAVDGVLRRAALSVDGLAWPRHAEILAELGHR